MILSEIVPCIKDYIIAKIEKESFKSLKGFEKNLGIGVYLIYYQGEKITYHDNNLPIYIGKAGPLGSRKGTDYKIYDALSKRLLEHACSIEQTELDIENFYFKALSVDPFFIESVEKILIEHFLPTWNRCYEGFGNHNPGINRINSKVSKWDQTHPGRTWFNTQKNNS